MCACVGMFLYAHVCVCMSCVCGREANLDRVAKEGSLEEAAFELRSEG